MRSITARDPLADAVKPDPLVWHSGVERRRSPRATLRWTLYLKGASTAHPLRTVTRNISRDGFYCALDRPLRPGERIDCDIVVPTHNLQDPENVAYLRCSAQVLRVEKIGTGAEFGIACRIEDYTVMHGTHTG